MLRVLRVILKYLLPLKSIADSLEKMVALYQADLASRTPPVFLVTEEPNESNTEVWYGDSDENDKLTSNGKKMQGTPRDWYNQDHTL